MVNRQRLLARIGAGAVLVGLAGCSSGSGGVASQPLPTSPLESARPVGTSPPCAVPDTREQIENRLRDVTLVVKASVATPPQELESLGTSRVIGYRLSAVEVLAGASATSVDMVAFNLAKDSDPITPGDYLLFLEQAPKVEPPRFYASYGIEGVFPIDDGSVYPLCVDWSAPGHPTVGASSVPLETFIDLLAEARAP